MSTDVLRVPLRVTALWVDATPLKVARPMADLTGLPYKNKNGDIVPATKANLAQNGFPAQLLPANNTYTLRAGLHLHWAIPDGLAMGYHPHAKADGSPQPPGSTTYWTVPDRWLITRLDGTGTTVQKQWVVESDYLHGFNADGEPVPDTSPASLTAPVTFPTRRPSDNSVGPAFRYMGHALDYSTWHSGKRGTGDYLNRGGFTPNNMKLTALGYGEPAFAAFYPNSSSVFGFVDDTITAAEATTPFVYRIVGWYAAAQADDPLLSEQFKGITGIKFFDALESVFKWAVDTSVTTPPTPTATVCYASLTVTPANVPPAQPTDTPVLAMGNTGTEALSALLGSRLATATATKEQLEDQLEAIALAPQLQGVLADHEARFAQARHKRGFVGVAAGGRWELHPRTPGAAKRASELTQQQLTAGERVVDPFTTAVVLALDALNQAQEAYDRAHHEIAELGYQTFCDWQQAMSAQYSGSSADFRAKMPQLSKFILNDGVATLTAKRNITGRLTTLSEETWQVDSDPAGNDAFTFSLRTNTFSPHDPGNVWLATNVLYSLRTLVTAVKVADPEGRYTVKLGKAPPFFRPRDPVVLIAGDVAVNSDRYDNGKDLPCTVVNMPDVPGSDDFINNVGELYPTDPNAPEIQTQDTSPWHPLLLEWSANVWNVTAPGAPELSTDYLTANFQLGNSAIDLVPLPTANLSAASNGFSGRCLLTPMAGDKLTADLLAFLLGTSLYDCGDPTAYATQPAYVAALNTWFAAEHAATPPADLTAWPTWAKLQRPFVQDGSDPPALLVPVLPATLMNWYATKPPSPTPLIGPDPIATALAALAALGNMQLLSQALGGFNAALLDRYATLQIPIEDPLQLLPASLTPGVAKAVGAHNAFAPKLDSVFEPLRTGEASMNSFTLIDSFGQNWSASTAELNGLVPSDALAPPNNTHPGVFGLPPRFAAPARLDVRWLSADGGQDGADEVEMSSVPTTNPICGWLVPNNFDGTIAVYDAEGNALGAIDGLAGWLPAPAATGRLMPAEIANVHLQRVVRSLVIDAATPSDERGGSAAAAPSGSIRALLVQGLLSVMDDALQMIEPANSAQQRGLAMLMGRPIAVTRMQVGLGLKGEPLTSTPASGDTPPSVAKAAPGDWNVFTDPSALEHDWLTYYDCTNVDGCKWQIPTDPPIGRTTRGFQAVRVPLRLGEHGMLEDGLVGYWVEAADGSLVNVIHCPQTDGQLQLAPAVTYPQAAGTSCIRPWDQSDPDDVLLTVADGPTTLTVLLDPRCVVHATCGMLPVQQVRIPSSFYAEALKNIAVSFRVGPLVTDSEQLYCAIPKEPGWDWSWITKPDGATWAETAGIADLTTHAQFFRTPMLVEGWLKLTPKPQGS